MGRVVSLGGVPTHPNPAANFIMNKDVSIVPADKRPYRIIAQKNWGLTDEQMKGKHVHHRIKRSEGGTNDPCNLYVCSPSFHRYIWHDGEEFIEFASKGGQIGGVKVHSKKDEFGRSFHAVELAKKLNSFKDEKGKSLNGIKAAERLHRDKDNRGKSLHAVKRANDLHSHKNEVGKSLIGVRGADKLHAAKDSDGKSLMALRINSQVWESTVDGYQSNSGCVARHNKANGWDPDARIRVA